jgi:hypothetical protein
MKRVLWAVLASLALTAAPVSAHVIRATSILPPGESGFLSAARLATGTGSPHLYDQQQPFIDFDRKDAMLGQPAAAMETPAPGVTIPCSPSLSWLGSGDLAVSVPVARVTPAAPR